MSNIPDVSIPILKDKLYFLCTSEDFKPPTSNKHIYFSTDKTLIYTAFFADFGPLNLGLTYQFCTLLDNHIKTAAQFDKIVIYYCSNHPHRRANSAVLICAYLVFVLNFSVAQAYAPFMGIDPPFTPFRDAAFSINTFPITVLDCTRSFVRAVENGHFNYKTFSLQQFVNMAKLENGDFSWIVPGKFIAFSGPISRRRDLVNGKTTLLPEEYIPKFRELGVTCIIRFNNKCYDKNIYTRAGIRHVDLFYEDGGNPTDAILQSFLQICERESGAIAVHCKAGLGRTGTNIAAYMMKHWRYTAKESTAWSRICRPGCVVGPQQQYLAAIEESIRPRTPPRIRATVSSSSTATTPSASLASSIRESRDSRDDLNDRRILQPTRSGSMSGKLMNGNGNGIASGSASAGLDGSSNGNGNGNGEYVKNYNGNGEMTTGSGSGHGNGSRSSRDVSSEGVTNSNSNNNSVRSRTTSTPSNTNTSGNGSGSGNGRTVVLSQSLDRSASSNPRTRRPLTPSNDATRPKTPGSSGSYRLTPEHESFRDNTQQSRSSGAIATTTRPHTSSAGLSGRGQYSQS
eukprot:gene9599-19951_t